MKATSAKNAAKKFIIEDDIYIVKTHRPEWELFERQFDCMGRPTAFEFKYWLNFKLSWVQAFPHISRIIKRLTRLRYYTYWRENMTLYIESQLLEKIIK